ncbi:hypothetical protein [Actinacidiphila soli]|nr:hypothetical protein [Actinacidiphila soli]
MRPPHEQIAVPTYLSYEAHNPAPFTSSSVSPRRPDALTGFSS